MCYTSPYEELDADTGVGADTQNLIQDLRKTKDVKSFFSIIDLIKKTYPGNEKKVEEDFWNSSMQCEAKVLAALDE